MQMTAVSPPSGSPEQQRSEPWSRSHPFPARLVLQRRLTAAGSAKDVRHIELDIAGSGMCYEPGDTLSVCIRNDPALVQTILAQCALDGQQQVIGLEQDMTLEQALLEHYEITQVHPGFIKHYAECSRLAEPARLATDAQALRQYLPHRQVIDVLREFPARLEAAQLLSCLRHLNPRQYSIASSPLMDPTRIALTVNMVKYHQNAETRTGAASSFLGWQVHAGDSVPVFVTHNPNFRLPADNTRPMVMIGPGTGIAPFRAFLQQRAAGGASGRNWLFTGNPVRATDFLYGDELLGYQRRGVLTRLDLAFSRDQAEKIYVQQRMLEHSAELFGWLEDGACLYVCGDARHMAEDVQKTLLEIIAAEGGLGAVEARQYLVKLRQDKRYQRDVY